MVSAFAFKNRCLVLFDIVAVMRRQRIILNSQARGDFLLVQLTWISPIVCRDRSSQNYDQKQFGIDVKTVVMVDENGI